jgi:hypothetical protein
LGAWPGPIPQQFFYVARVRERSPSARARSKARNATAKFLVTQDGIFQRGEHGGECTQDAGVVFERDVGASQRTEESRRVET